jgi:hypothetical protein
MRARNAFLATILAAAAWPVAAQDKQPLTGPEIATLVSGNTVKGPYYTEYFDPDGSIRGIEKGKRYEGSWRVDKDRLCVDFPSHQYTDCAWIAPQDGSDYSFMDGQFTFTRTIVAGNPEKL